MKAAGLLTISEAKKLAGVDSLTIAPDLLRTLAKTPGDETEVSCDSLFAPKAEAADRTNGHAEPKSFLNNEIAYREGFAKSYGGKGEAKTKQVSFDAFPLALRHIRGLEDPADISDPFEGNCYLQRISAQGRSSHARESPVKERRGRDVFEPKRKA